MTTPLGMGVYARPIRVDEYGSPQAFAAKLKANKLSWVAFLGAWFEPLATNVAAAKIPAYAAACHAAGLDVWLWGYPWAGNEGAYVGAMRDVTKQCGGSIVGWLHDPEKSYTKGDHDRNAFDLVMLERAARSELNIAGVGVTSYPIPKFFPRFPWDIFSQTGGFGSPQTYTIPTAQIPVSFDGWKKAGFSSILPSIPAYGENSNEHLDAYIAALVAAGAVGMSVWSFPQLDDREWKTLAKWGEQLSARACK